MRTNKRNTPTLDNISNKKNKTENDKLRSLNKYCEKVKSINAKTSEERLDQYNQFTIILDKSLKITKSLNERLIEKEDISSSNEHLETLKRNLEVIFNLFISRHLSSLNNTVTRHINEINRILSKLKKQPNENNDFEVIETNEVPSDTTPLTSYLLEKRIELKEKSHIRNELFSIIDPQTNQERMVRLRVFDHCLYYQENEPENFGIRLKIFGEELVTENSDKMEVLFFIEERSSSLFYQIRQRLLNSKNDRSFTNDALYFFDTIKWALDFESNQMTIWTDILLNQITKLKEKQSF